MRMGYRVEPSAVQRLRDDAGFGAFVVGERKGSEGNRVVKVLYCDNETENW